MNRDNSDMIIMIAKPGDIMRVPGCRDISKEMTSES